MPRLPLLALLAMLASVAVVPWAGQERPAPGALPAASVAPDRGVALAALRAWDRERADAWRRGDPDSLAGLYTAGSAAGVADRDLLAAYADRGLRVAGLRMQRAAVRVQVADDSRLVLEVVDRLVGAVAVERDGTRIALPRDDWSRRRVVLRRVAGGWRVVEVRDQRSAAASTAETSGSANS